jgi:hypothetical protein
MFRLESNKSGGIQPFITEYVNVYIGVPGVSCISSVTRRNSIGTHCSDRFVHYTQPPGNREQKNIVSRLSRMLDLTRLYFLHTTLELFSNGADG